MNNRDSRPPRREDRAPQGISDATLAKINLANPDSALFDTTAEEIARQISDCKGELNKSTQLRRFYDEVCSWHAKIMQKPDDFTKLLPLIRMLNAKVAYAEGRKLVDSNFRKLIQDCLRKVETKEQFNNFKTFFEAFLGFYKIHKPK